MHTNARRYNPNIVSPVEFFRSGQAETVEIHSNPVSTHTYISDILHTHTHSHTHTYTLSLSLSLTHTRSRTETRLDTIRIFGSLWDCQTRKPHSLHCSVCNAESTDTVSATSTLLTKQSKNQTLRTLYFLLQKCSWSTFRPFQTFSGVHRKTTENRNPHNFPKHDNISIVTDF